MRRMFADIAATILFSTVTAMPMEIFITGLTLAQSVQARIFALLPNTLLGRPYGLFRDVLVRVFNPESRPARIATDVGAFVGFWIPIYALNLALTGATAVQILVGCVTLTIASAFFGRPYGLTIEWSRRLFRA